MENLSFGITTCHHSASRAMQNGNHLDRFSYPILTLMMDSYILSHPQTHDTFFLSNDVKSGSEITPCNKIDKLPVAYRISGNFMTSITTLHT